MRYTCLIGIFCFLGLSLGEKAIRFDNFKVYKVLVANDAQLKDFKQLGKNLDVHYLKDVGAIGQSYDVAVAPAAQAAFEQRLADYKLSFQLLIKELQKVLDYSWSNIEGILNPKLNWTSFHSLSTIYNWVDSQVLRNPFVVKPYIFGKSYEGRPLKAVKISKKPGNKAIFIEANIHAIEWITSAAGTCFMNKLLTSTDPEISNLLANYDWIFVPVLNPDGFEYSHNVNRLWRKNRKPTGFSNSSGICYGVDMNRNFDFFWGGQGYNIDVPCDHWYGGAKAASEPEIQAQVDFVNSFPDGYIRMYLALHSYGNLVLLPYGHTTTEVPSNYNQMVAIAKGFADAAKTRYGTDFLYGPSGKLLYPVSGAAKDWAYGVKGIPFTATIELRDRGTYGFFLPPAQIQPVCDELTDGIIGMVKTAEQQGLFK